MIYRGHVEGGMIVLDSPDLLPEGTNVLVSVPEHPLDINGDPIDPIFLIGDFAVDTGIPDLASNIDHYLYGHPKVEDGR